MEGQVTRAIATVLFGLLVAGSLVGMSEAGEAPGPWPKWRGPDETGAAAAGNPPVEWSESKNVRWKIAIPGRGASSPIVLGDVIYLTTAVPVDGAASASPAPEPSEGASPQGGRRRGPPPRTPDAVLRHVVLAIDRHDGTVRWEKTVRETKPTAGTHATSTWASNSAVTDGTHVFAYFGSQGLYCLDLDGNVVWERDLGDMKKRREFGEGSSPVLHGDKVFILWDHEGPSALFALDKKTGKDLWKVDRDEISSWSTPLVVEHGGTPHLITNATDQVAGYHADTGELLWHTTGMTVNVIPTPVTLDGVVYAMSGFRGAALRAIRLEGAKGDLTGTDSIAWSLDRDTPYTPSPLLYDGTLYFLKTNRAILSSFDARTGKEHYSTQRLEGLGSIYASPVGVADRVYVTDRDGSTAVVRHGPDFEVLATNTLDDGFDASMALVGDEILLRGQTHLYCIGKD
jgi:outer membrane protein assembly factor BamB